MAIVRTDYTAKAASASSVNLVATGVKVGDVIVVGIAFTGAAVIAGVSDSFSNTYYNTGASSPGTGTGPCGIVISVTKSIAAGSVTITASAGAATPADLLLYVGVCTSNAGGIMLYDPDVFAGGQNTGASNTSVNYPFFLDSAGSNVVNQMEIGVQAAGATYLSISSHATAIVANLTTADSTYLSAIVNTGVTVGYTSYTMGWTLTAGIDSAFGLALVYEYLPVTCSAAPSTGFKVTGVGIGVGEVYTTPTGALQVATDPVNVVLKSVPKGSAIIVVIGKYIGEGTYNTLTVGDGVNTYTNRLSYVDGATSSVTVEVWSAIGVAAGDYTIKSTFQHLTTASINQAMHVHVIVVTPADPTASVAFDVVAPVNSDATSPTATKGSATIVTTKNFDFIIGVCTAFPAFSPPVYPTVNLLWTTPTTDSTLIGASSTQDGFVQLGSFFAQGEPIAPGSKTLTQPWIPAATNSWVSGAAAFGTATKPVAPSGGASRLPGRHVTFG